MYTINKVARVSNCSLNEKHNRIATLPEYLIIDEILPKLPVKSLLRFKCVSKYWQSSISSHYFTKTHLKSSSISHNFVLPTNDNLNTFEDHHYLFLVPFDESTSNIKNSIPLKFDGEFNIKTIDFVGCCDGIVCLYINEGDNYDGWFALWNPATRHYRAVKDPNDKYFPSFYGFCHASSIDDYKIVAFFKENDDNDDENNENNDGRKNSLGLHVFSVRKGEWKRINNEGFELEHKTKVMLIDDSVFWPPTTLKGSIRKIQGFLGLNLFSEQLIEIPMTIAQRMINCRNVSVTKERLDCLGAKRFDFWKFEEIGDKMHIWKDWCYHNNNLTKEEYLNLPNLMKTGKCLLWRLRQVDLVNSSTMAIQVCTQEGDEASSYHVLDNLKGYYESLVSPLEIATTT